MRARGSPAGPVCRGAEAARAELAALPRVTDVAITGTAVRLRSSSPWSTPTNLRGM